MIVVSKLFKCIVRSIFQIGVFLMFSFESLSFYEYQHNSIVCQTFFFISFLLLFIRSGKHAMLNLWFIMFNVLLCTEHRTPVCIPFISYSIKTVYEFSRMFTFILSLNSHAFFLFLFVLFFHHLSLFIFDINSIELSACVRSFIVHL